MRNGVRLQMFERALEIVEQQLREIAADAVADQYPLDDGRLRFAGSG